MATGGQGWRRVRLLAVAAVVIAVVVAVVVTTTTASTKHPTGVLEPIKNETAPIAASSMSAPVEGSAVGDAAEDEALAQAGHHHFDSHASSGAAAGPGSSDGKTVVHVLADVTQQASSATGKQVVPTGDVCSAANIAELEEAVEDKTCGTVLLTSTEPDAYRIVKEIIVRRRVVVTGRPSTMPLINAEDANRAFRVKPGGWLELEYLQLTPGGDDAVTRRQAQGGAPSSNTVTVRGGAVLFEPGALGGVFVGVFFVQDSDPDKQIEEAIERTMEQTTVRVYGGFVLVAGGDVDFIGCLFWLPEIVSPLSDVIQFGGQILMLAGNVRMTGCVWWEINVFGIENGVGLNVLVLGGSFIVTFTDFNEANVAGAFNAVGEAFLTAGGVSVYTGLVFNEWSALLWQAGTGCLSVGGGVQVITGMNLIEAIGVGAYFGAGMEVTLGAGVSLFFGAHLQDYNGLYNQASVGEMSFTGAGTLVAIGSPLEEYTAIIGERGAGNFMASAAGDNTLIGCPMIDCSAIGTWWGTGEFLAFTTGHVTFWGGWMMDLAVILGWYGLGIFFYVGSGTLVLGGTGFLHEHLVKTPDIDIWVNGGCNDPVPDGTPIPYNYGLPTFITLTSFCDYTRLGGAPRALEEEQSQPQLAATEEADPVGDNGLSGALAEMAVGLEQQVGILIHDVKFYDLSPATIDALPIPPASKQLLLSVSDGMATLREALTEPAERRVLVEQDSASSTVTAPVWKKRRQRPSPKRELAVEPEGTHARVHLEKAPVGRSCNIFMNPDMVTGPGAEHCNVTDPNDPAATSSAIDAMPANVRAILRGDEDGPIAYTSTYVVVNDLRLPTRPGAVVGVSWLEAGVKRAAEAWRMQQGVSDEHQIFVQVYGSDPSMSDESAAVLADILADMAALRASRRRRALYATDDFSETQHYKAVFTSSSKAVADGIVADADGLASLIDAELAASLAEGWVEHGPVDLSHDTTLRAPAYKKRELAAGPVPHLGAHTVTLSDPETPALPLKHAEFGREYVLHLERFPANRRLTLELKRVTGRGEESLALSLGTVEADDDGTVQVPHTFRQGELEAGDYFLEGRGEGVQTHSPLFTLLPGRTTRRLYGASVYL